MKFETLFRSDACQTFKLNGKTDPDKPGKLVGSDHSSKPFVAPTAKHFAEHLEGKTALTVRLGPYAGCIDIDPENYKTFDAVAYCKLHVGVITEAKLIPCYSKSGGVRLWRFMAERSNPKQVRVDLEFWSQRFGGDVTIDIFPTGDSLCMLPFFGDTCGMLII